MRELAFLITGLSEDEARKLRRRRPSRAPARVVGWALLGVALVYLLVSAKPAVKLEIASPASGTTTRNPQIPVTGKATGIQADAVTLEVNGSPQTVPVLNGSFEAPVSLVLGDNAIRVSQDDVVSNEVVVKREPLPVVIQIDSPQDGSAQDSSTRVTGTITNPQGPTVTLTVNGSGQTLPIRNGSFTADVNVSIGENRIRASQGDAVSNEVVVKREPPLVVIQIRSPQTGSTQDSSTRVTGIITNPQGPTVALTVHGSGQTLPIRDGSFTADVKLAFGDNHIRVSQGDAASDEVVVRREPPPVVIQIRSPQSGSTQDSSTRVTGTITNPRGSTVTLTVNGSGQTLPIRNGRFTADVKLAFGENRIRASQGDDVSNEVVVNRVPPLRVVIQIRSPQSGSTRDSSTRVTGTITNPQGPTVTLTANGSGQTLPIRNGSFAADVKLAFGENRIQASQGVVVSNEVIVTRPIEPRTLIRITSPETGPTKESAVKVTGTITNQRGDTLTLMVNGFPSTVRITDGGFASVVKLRSGGNRIQASQGDSVSNAVVVTRATEPRTLIRITSPRTGPTKESSVKVTGTITSPRGDTITLTVNGSSHEVQVSDGGFASAVKLRPGDNRIQASQGDAVSNEVVVSRVVQTDGDKSTGTSECGKINCDCKNLKASRIPTDNWSRAFRASVTAQPPRFPTSVGASPQDRQAQCRAEEDTLRQRCRETGKVTGVCPPDASGPSAWPSKKPRSFIPRKTRR